jgi:hypothetical protein
MRKRSCDELGERILELSRVRRKLRAIIKRCDASKPKTSCHFIDVLKGRD